MLEEIATLYRIIKREKESRRHAEQLLEQKSRELFDKTAELEKAANKFKSVNTLLSEILSVAPDIIITCHGDFTIHGCNRAGETALGLSENALISRSVDDFLPGLSADLKKRGVGPFFLENRRACGVNGDSFPVEIRGHVGPIGDNINYLVFFHDISHRLNADDKRKKMEQQVDEARRLEAIGALSAGIAHEINTPIQFIGDNLDYLEDALRSIHKSYKSYDALKTAAEAASVCCDAVARVEELNQSISLPNLIKEINAALGESREGIKQVRDIVLLMKEFAHPGTDDKDAVDLNAIVSNVVAICRNRRKHIADVELKLDPALPRVRCRKGQVQQVVLNIVLNAIDAIDEKQSGKGRIEIETRAGEQNVELLISDTGAGVPQSLKEKIFDPFFTTKPVGKGTGQGLALAKDCIVKGHGGKLSLIDKESFATTFLIELPLSRALQENLKETNDGIAA
ncbi:MAG: ATP-binding protein [Parvularculaceae bacterium]